MEGPAAVGRPGSRPAPAAHASAPAPRASRPAAAPATGAPITAARVRELSRVLEQIRGRKFKTPVQVTFLSKAELSPRLVKLFDAETPPLLLAQEAALLKGWQVIPDGADLRQLYLTLLTAQVVGLYDPSSKALYVVTDAQSAAPSGTGGDDAQVQALLQGINPIDIAIVHELDHALSDQWFDLEKFLRAAEGDPDRAAALQALVEGEATLAMVQYSLDSLLGAEGAGGVSERDALAAVGEQLSPETLGVLNANDPTLKDLPPYLVEKLEASYADGLRYVLAVHARGGWAAVETLYRSPPRTTREMLHPGLAPSWRRPAVSIAAPPGWSLLRADVLGEQDVGILLRDPARPDESRALASVLQLSGDALFTAPLQGRGPDAPGLPRAVAWYSEWATPADRGRFIDAARRRWPKAAIAEQRGTGVLVSLGFSASEAAALKPPPQPTITPPQPPQPRILAAPPR